MESQKCFGTPQSVSTSEQTNANDFENLMKELKVLRDENTILKGRLRGIDTLGALLQEARDTNTKLSEQKNKLQQRLDDSISQKQNKTIESTGEVITSISDIGQIYQPNTTETNDIPAEPAVSFHVQVSEGVKLSVTESGVVSGNSSQISLPDIPQSTHGKTTAGMTDNQVQPSDSIKHHDQDLQYDSEEEPSYPKTKELNSLCISSFSSPSFGQVVSSHMDESSFTFDDQQNIDLLHIQSHGESYNLNLPSLYHSTGDSINPQKLQETISYLKVISDDRTKYKHLYHVITKENGTIKKEIAVLRNENKKLLQRVQQLEHYRDNIESESLTQAVNKDWVHISSNKVKKEEEVKRHSDYSSALKQIKELKTANKAWQTKWDSLEKQYSTRNRLLEKEIDSLKSEIKHLIKTHEENQLEADKMLMNAKQRVEEEEEGKMAATDSVHKANQELKEVKMRIEELERELSDVKKAKSIAESELSILRNAGQERKNYEKNKDVSIEVLKQQITICTEDFERERQDRATAQAARSVLQEENNQLVEEKQNLTAQVNRITRQLQDIELANRRLQSDNENHQTHIGTLKAENHRLRGQLQSALAQVNIPTRTYSQVQNITPPLIESVHLPNPISPHVQSAPRYREQPSLEHLPGAWTCGACTYINYPGRTVCEMCGSITEHGNGNPHMQGLQPRGPLEYSHRDLEIDACH